MNVLEMVPQIEAAVAEEQSSHRLRSLLARWAVQQGRQPTQQELDGLIAFITDYIRHVPPLLGATYGAAQAAGLDKPIEPLLHACKEYWFENMDVIPDHLGLVGYMDDAYYVLSILQMVSELAHRANGTPLLDANLGGANGAMRLLIGEPQATQVDMAIMATAGASAFQTMFRHIQDRGSWHNAIRRTIDPVADVSEIRWAGMGTEGGGGGGAYPAERAASEAPVYDLTRGPFEISPNEPAAQSSADSDELGVEDAADDGSVAEPDELGVEEAAAEPPMDDSDELGLEKAPPVRRNGSPRPTPSSDVGSRGSRPPVSTGFAPLADPGGYVREDRPIAPGERYYFWLEVREALGSIEEKPEPIPAEHLPANARLVVVLFTPDGGFRPKANEDLGELELQSDGTARVVAQPAKRHPDADAELLKWRLLFPVTAPAERGAFRLRCSIYCHGVLVQSRIITVEVGATSRKSRVDYTLESKLNPAKLQSLAEHRFSMLSNRGPRDNHDFYVYGGKGKKAFRDSISIPANTLSGTLEIARAALRRASWGDEDQWTSQKRYRYDGKPSIDRLREDLAVLAIAGWRIYDGLVHWLAGGKSKVKGFSKLVSEPGLVQISPDATLGMVLPAALIYDYKIKVQAKPAAEFGLCHEFERAFRQKTPFEETACFQGQCPSRGEPTTVCPSGFWGFRHGLGLPISDIEEDEAETQETDFDLRLEYGEVPVIVVGVSRAPDLPRTGEHRRELEALRPDWGKRPWLVEDSLEPLLELMRTKQPHLVYLYCHSSGRPVGSSEIPMLYLGASPEDPKPGEWLERSMLRGEVEWTKPRPLVFLNGCHTTLLDARTTLDFVTGFVQNSNACGVIGTEITVFEPLAGEFATRFIARFLGGAVVGQAIRDARLDLLAAGNPLGLVYTPFVLSGTQLVRTGL